MRYVHLAACSLLLLLLLLGSAGAVRCSDPPAASAASAASAAAAAAPVASPSPAPAPAQRTPEEEYQRLLALQRAEPAPPLSTGSGVTAQDVRFTSAILGRAMRYRVLLPTGYGSSHRYYPVLYLLHGYMNPYYEWDKQTSLARLLERDGRPLIVVMPQFDNSFYLNAAEEPKDRYMSYFFRDLLPDVESRFRARSEPPARAIAGVSMGGYGAMLYALRFPHAFSFAASFSGALDFMAQGDQWAETLAPFPLAKLIGKPDSPTRRENDLMRLVQSVDPATLPPLWMTCGGRDFLLDDNLAFFKALRERNIPVELHSAPGQHEWVTWEAQLPSMLRALDRALGQDGQ